MTDNFFSIGGIDYPINGPEDVQKALGNVPIRQIIMTDESGAVIGTGNSVASVNKSMPLVKSLNEQQGQLHKTNKLILFTKTKSKVGELKNLVEQMNGMKKSLTVNVEDSDTQERLDIMAAAIDQVTDYLEVCISRGILPARI